MEQTSLLAFDKHVHKFSRREQQVLDVIEQYQPIDNQGIADMLGLPVHSITGRTNALANPKTSMADGVRPSLIHVVKIAPNKYGNTSKYWGTR